MAVAPESRRKRVQRTGKQTKPWEPSTRDLEVYRLICEGKLTQAQVAEKFTGIGRARVGQIAAKVDAWLAPQLMESVRSIKARHTQHLMVIFREAMRAWDDSKLESGQTSITEDDRGTSTTTTTRSNVGNAAFLTQARQALAEIRQIWGADAPLEVRHGLEVRVAGRPIDDAAAEVIRQMEEAKKRIIDVTGAK